MTKIRNHNRDLVIEYWYLIFICYLVPALRRAQGGESFDYAQAVSLSNHDLGFNSTQETGINQYGR